MGLSGGGDIGVVALLGLVGGMRGYWRRHGFAGSLGGMRGQLFGIVVLRGLHDGRMG